MHLVPCVFWNNNSDFLLFARVNIKLLILSLTVKLTNWQSSQSSFTTELGNKFLTLENKISTISTESPLTVCACSGAFDPNNSSSSADWVMSYVCNFVKYRWRLIEALKPCTSCTHELGTCSLGFFKNLWINTYTAASHQGLSCCPSLFTVKYIEGKTWVCLS